MNNPNPSEEGPSPRSRFGDVSRAEATLRSAYRAFNARDVDVAVELMQPDVDWPDAFEGGRVIAREAVRSYWRRQFAAISSNVDPWRASRMPRSDHRVARR